MSKELKTISCPVRAFNREHAIETREVEFVISTPTRDRHATVIPLENWMLENYNRNGIVGYQHDVYGDSFLTAPDPDSVIGRGRVYVENGELIGKVTFEPAEINPRAEKIFQKILFGSLSATSVGFIEQTDGRLVEKDPAQNNLDTYYFGQVELVEFSIVNIPSNPKALRRGLEPANEQIVQLTKSVETLTETNRLLTQTIEILKNKIEELKLDVEYFSKKASKGK